MNYSKTAHEVRAMFGSIAPRYDLANKVLSAGIDRWWRYVFLRSIRGAHPEIALDVCTGTGDLLAPLSRRVKKVYGLDFCLPMLRQGQQRSDVIKAGTPLIQGDALRLPFADNTFDLITVAFGIRNFENLQSGVLELHRVLRPGGKLLVLEFGQPQGLFWGGLYRLYSRFLMPQIGGLLTGNKAAYAYLPQTAQEFPCGDKLAAILSRCNFQVKSCSALSGGIAYSYQAQK